MKKHRHNGILLFVFLFSFFFGLIYLVNVYVYAGQKTFYCNLNFYPVFSVVVLLTVLAVWITAGNSIWVTAGYSLILSGGVANLTEFLTFGCVRDYLSFFGIFGFNAADLLISIGVLTITMNMGIKAVMSKHSKYV